MVNVTPAASAPLAQNDVQVTPTPTQEPAIQAGVLFQNSLTGLTISGRVTDASQKPLPGVAVRADPQHTAISLAGIYCSFTVIK